MNPAVIAFVGSIAMRIVMAVAGLLIGANLLTPEQFEMIREVAASWLTGLILAAASIGYGIVRNYINRRKLMKAMALPFPVNENQLEARIKAGGAPSVFTPKDEMPGPSTSPKPAA